MITKIFLLLQLNFPQLLFHYPSLQTQKLAFPENTPAEQPRGKGELTEGPSPLPLSAKCNPPLTSLALQHTTCCSLPSTLLMSAVYPTDFPFPLSCPCSIPAPYTSRHILLTPATSARELGRVTADLHLSLSSSRSKPSISPLAL